MCITITLPKGWGIENGKLSEEETKCGIRTEGEKGQWIPPEPSLSECDRAAYDPNIKAEIPQAMKDKILNLTNNDNEKPIQTVEENVKTLPESIIEERKEQTVRVTQKNVKKVDFCPHKAFGTCHESYVAP